MGGPATAQSSDTPVRPAETAADLALRSAEARFRVLFEQAQVGILLADSQSRYLDANASVCRMLGYAREELIGLTAADIIVPSEAASIAPTIDAITRGGRQQKQWRFRRKDGSTLPVEVIATHMPDGTLLGTIQDLSEREQAGEVRGRLAAIVESSLDGIIGEDLDGVITSWNAGAEAIFGYAAEAMIGSTVARLIPPERRHEQVTARQAWLNGTGPATVETQRLTSDGRLLDVSIATSPIRDARGHLVGLSKSVRDITPLKQRERELSRLSRLYAALSGINQAIALNSTRDVLFAKVCDVLVQQGCFSAALIRWHDPATGRLVAVAHSGRHGRELANPDIHTEDGAEGQMPSSRAFRTGRAVICNDIRLEPTLLPWKPLLLDVDVKAMACLPIRLDGVVCAILAVCADRQDFFHDKEIGLLEEAAFDISFALDNAARDEAKRMAEATLRSEKRFSDTMIDSFPGILYFYDAEGRFLRWNRNFAVATGYSDSEIAGMHPLDFFTPEERPVVQDRIRAALTEGEATVEAGLRHRSGTTRPYLLTGRRVVFGGGPCLIGAGIDISAQRRAEAERERRHRAEAADRVKSAFLATMSHELRTPLNSIIGFTGILLQGLAGPLNPEQGKQLGMVRNSARHLLALVNDVLDISKIEAGQLEVACHPFDPRASIEKVLALMTPMAEAKHLPLCHHLAEDLGAAVGDARRFEQILLNLVSNAIKFTQAGSVTVTAMPITLHRAGAAGGVQPAIRVAVADTGIGVPPEDLDDLFEPFRQIMAPAARSPEGTGLGLAICRKLAGLMGGEVTAESVLGRGSVFTVTLPLQARGAS